VVLGGTSLMGGKFSIAGTVIGVFTIQTLKSTITFLGVPPAVSPLFLALVVIIVVLVQSQRVRTWAKRLVPPPGSRPGSDGRGGVEVAS
jgi:ribose/xylose/arabinose/galactoside ABC-type transport system permease subunit